MKKILFFFFSIVLFFSCRSVNSNYFIIPTNFLPTADTVLIFKPNNYDSLPNTPLVILLHGYGGNYKQWNDIVELQELSDKYNFLIACPDGLIDSWYINNPNRPKIQFEDFFWKDFIPYLKERFNIDSNNVFITGLSMGGHGAMTLFLKNPEFFKSAASSSGILDLTYFPNRWSLNEGIGPYKDYPEIWESNSAINLLKNLIKLDKIILFDCGTEDFAYLVNLNFANECKRLGINYKFVTPLGDHNRIHWAKMLHIHLEFFYNQKNK